MRFTIRNHVLAQVEDRARFLEHLIEEYPRLLKEWTDKTDNEFKQDAEEYSDGDRDMFSSIYSSMQTAFDENEYREDLFYKSMLLMTYAYYESTVSYFARKVKTNEIINAICRSNNIELSSDAKEAVANISSNIRIVRNQLIHNNMGNPQHVDDLLRISNKWDGIDFANDEITISKPDFVLDSLRKELLVLSELSLKMGYKHKKVQTSK